MAAAELALPEPAAEAPASRRQRQLALPGEIVADSLAGKVLHAWLQNRHQTLYPLTVNLRALDPGRASLLARMMATSSLAGGRVPGAERLEDCVAWLRRAGAGDAVIDAFRDARDTPVPLRALLQEVQGAGVAAYAYVVSLVAVDGRDEAGQRFLDYLAVRLDLPINVIRSADRRYRSGASASVRVVSAA